MPSGGLLRWLQGPRTPAQNSALQSYFEEIALIFLGQAILLKCWSDRGIRAWRANDLGRLNWAISTALKPHLPARPRRLAAHAAQSLLLVPSVADDSTRVVENSRGLSLADDGSALAARAPASPVAAKRRAAAKGKVTIRASSARSGTLTAQLPGRRERARRPFGHAARLCPNC